MPATARTTSHRSATGTTRPRLPATAERLRLPLYARSQERLATRWGFDLNAPDAQSRAEALLAQSPRDADRLLLVAAVRSSRGDDQGALAAAQQAVAEDEGSARAQTTLATLLARTGDGAAAQPHAELAATLDPNDPAAVYNRGLVAWTMGDRRAARADFDRAAELLGFPAPPWWQRWRRGR
jgi:Flp pilus assembly protein TadD